MSRFVISAFFLAAAVGLAAQAPIASVKPGHYCMRTEIGSADEDDEPAPAASLGKLDDGRLPGQRTRLGLFGVDVDVLQKDNQTLVSFSNFMPDNGQIVRIEPAVAAAGSDGRLTFSFTDNWKARGKGVVQADGADILLSIERTSRPEGFAGEYSDRQFGEFKLKPGTCPAYSSAR